MAALWASKIIEGKKTFVQVPRLLKDQVREILTDRGYADLIAEDDGELQKERDAADAQLDIIEYKL